MSAHCPLPLCCRFACLHSAGCGLRAFPQLCLLKTRRGFWFSHFALLSKKSFPVPDQDASLEPMAQDNGQRICCTRMRTGIQMPRTHVKAEQAWGPPAIPVLHRQRQDPEASWIARLPQALVALLGAPSKARDPTNTMAEENTQHQP